MIKKVLLPVLLFLTSFIITDNVSATADNVNTVYFDLEHTSYTNTYEAIKPKLEEVITYIKNNNPNNYHWSLFLGRDNSGPFLYLSLLPSNFSNTVGSGNYCLVSAYTYYVSSSSSYYYQTGGCKTNNIAIKTYTIRSNTDITDLKTDLSLNYSSISGMSAGSRYKQLASLNKFTFTNNEYYYFSNNTNFILPYASSVRIYNSELMTAYKIKIGKTELIIDPNSYLEPSDNYFEVMKPISVEITLEDYELMADYYSSLTYKLTFSEFDTEKYRYYYTFDPNDIDSQITRLQANQILKNDILLTFEMNTTFYVVVKDTSNKNVLLVSYEVNNIMNSRYDESLDVLDKHPDLPDKIDETTDITDNFTVGNIIGWFRSLIDKRLPILSQISGVYQAFKFDLKVDSDCIEQDYDYTEEKGYIWRSYCNKIPELNLKGIFGIDKSFEIIDVRFFWQYRETVFFWTKLSLGTYTFIKLLKIVANYFKH